MTKIRPLGNNLFLRRAEAAEKIGSLYVPDTAKKQPHRGTVVAAGPGVMNDSGTLIPNPVVEGDLVLFPEGLGRDITVDGETLVILSSDLALAVIEAP